MAYPAKAVANYFIEKAIEEGDGKLNLMKLLKLIYLAHGWFLAFYNKPLINEKVQAWQYGPVVEEIYQAFKNFGMRPIDQTIEELVIDKGKVRLENYKHKFDDQTQQLLDNVWRVYKPNTGIELSNWSHTVGSPWDKAWNEQGGYKYRNFAIDNNLIEQYFKEEGKKGGTEHRKQAS
jgi:uncharacterized phage-associated protein